MGDRVQHNMFRHPHDASQLFSSIVFMDVSSGVAGSSASSSNVKVRVLLFAHAGVGSWILAVDWRPALVEPIEKLQFRR